MFSLDSLRCLCAVVETGNFRLAAERVHRSQPAVSQQLKKMEQEAGQPLLERKTGKLTEAGEIVYTRARRMLLDMDNLADEMRDLNTEGSTTLRVGTSDTTALYVLPIHVRRFMKEHPQTRLTLISRSSNAITGQVVKGEVDLGIVTLPQEHAELEVQELFQQQLVLVLPVHHALAKRRSIQLKDLDKIPMLQLDPTTQTGSLLEAFFARHNFAPQAAIDSGSFEVIKRYIKEGAGVAFLPQEALTEEDHTLTTIPMAGLPTVPIGAIWRKGAYQSRVVQDFLAQLQRGEGRDK